MASSLRVAAIQMAPVFLDASQTWSKLLSNILAASQQGAVFVTWGETLIPGYPAWLSPSGGATFDDADQKQAFCTYWQESLHIASSEIIGEMKQLSFDKKLTLMGGIAERDDRSSSLFCTLLTVCDGQVVNRHRKLKPTFEERLVWADGDARGLKTHHIPIANDLFRFGGLNCWENWMPNARAALHGQGETLHVAVWPGSYALTEHISRFMALEGRSWIVSVSGLLRPSDFAHLDEARFPMKRLMTQRDGCWQDGGSVILNPRGEVVAGPLLNEEGILLADIDCLMASVILNVCRFFGAVIRRVQCVYKVWLVSANAFLKMWLTISECLGRTVVRSSSSSNLTFICQLFVLVDE